jgi:glycerophosphoryl diester phosphodiesterase
MAHRGNRVACPENTLAAFKRAIAEGTDILETDLRLTEDSEFVCIHDETVDRTTDGRGAVADMTLATIKKFSAACGREEFVSERVPTLSEVAALVPEDVILALELKTDRFLEPPICRHLIAELDRLGILDRTILLSFSLPRLRAVRGVDSKIPIGWITLYCPWPFVGTQLLGPYWPLLLINPLYVLLAHLKGLIVCPLDSEPDKRMWLYRFLGVDAILTDDPDATYRAIKHPDIST